MIQNALGRADYTYRPETDRRRGQRNRAAIRLMRSLEKIFVVKPDGTLEDESRLDNQLRMPIRLLDIRRSANIVSGGMKMG